MKIYSSYPKLANEIKKVIEERNIFAHYYLSIEDGAKELPAGTVRFHKMKHAHTYVDYDEVKIKNLHDRIESLISYILKFIDD